MPKVAPTQTDPTGLVTSADAARRLRKSPATISRWVRDGKLSPALKLSGLRGGYLFHEADIAELVAVEDLRYVA